MQKIKQLSEMQAAKIAAGEVIERPANIVKELVENAIDAKASAISIYLRDGGRHYIRIVDNGFGMSPQDAKMCIKHHATSKIETVDDLESITTFGFRGEALSSIASISKMNIITKLENDSLGTNLTIEAGNIIDQYQISCNTGTEIIIDDIFFNIPARKKFLKSKETEWRAILSIFNSFCLDYINIHFKIYSDDKIIHNCPPAATLIDRIKQLYDTELTNTLCIINGNSSNMNLKIHGAITDSHYSRYDRNLIFIFVNNRWVKNYKLSQAVIKGYKSVLPTGRFPAGFIFISCDTHAVDINIHPRKEEVMFLHPKVVETLLENAVSNALETKVLEKLRPAIKVDTNTPSNTIFGINNKTIYTNLTRHNKQNYDQIKLQSNDPLPINPIPVQLIQTHVSESWQSQSILETLEKTNDFKILAQLNKTYILVETVNGLTMVDQHAANERVLYEKYINNFKNAESFNLITPKIISLNSHGLELINKNLELFLQSGLEIDIIGREQIAIKKIPIYLKDKSLDDLIKDIINSIVNENISSNIFIEKIRAQMSCSGAVKAGTILNTIQMQAIIESLFSVENRLTCPHGRPTLWLLNNIDIEKKFKRDYK